MTAGVTGSAKRLAPRHGTTRRWILLMMLRPQGLRTEEYMERTGYQNSARLKAEIGRLMDDYDYDIRSIRDPGQKSRGFRRGRPPVIYRLVGKWGKKNRYRSFIGDQIQGLGRK